MKTLKTYIQILFWVIFTCVILSLGVTVCAEVPSEIIFAEDFKMESLDSWTKELMGTSSDVYVSDGELCLETSSYRDNPRVYPTFPTPLEYEFFSVEFSMRIEGSAESRQFALRDSADNWFNVFSYVSDGKVALWQTSPSNTDFTLKNNETYNIRYELYNTKEKAHISLYINGNYIGDVDAPAKWNNKLKRIYFLMYSGSSNVSNTYIDNVIVRVKPDDFYYNSSFNLTVDTLSFYNEEGKCYYLSDGKLNVEATVRSDKDTTAKLILAQYTKTADGLVFDKMESSFANIKKGESVDLTVPINIENAENSIVKVFLFDSLERLCPILPVTYVFPRWDSAGVSHPNNVNNYNYLSLLGYSERERILSEDRAFLENTLT